MKTLYFFKVSVFCLKGNVTGSPILRSLMNSFGHLLVDYHLCEFYLSLPANHHHNPVQQAQSCAPAVTGADFFF